MKKSQLFAVIVGIFLGSMFIGCGSSKDCTPNSKTICKDGSTWWVDSCGKEGDKAGDCVCGCSADFSACKDPCDCTPSCDGKECGPNGCGGVCATCTGGEVCSNSGMCVACIPPCSCGQICISGTCAPLCGPGTTLCGCNDCCESNEYCDIVTQTCKIEG